MPEGPEIRIAADKIAKVVEGKIIEKIDVGLPALEPHVEALTGRKVTQLETRGKALLTHFDNGLTIYSHNQLYGVWKTKGRDEIIKSNRSLRLALHTKTHSALLFSASDISVWPRDDLHKQPLLSKLGPDVLSANLSEDDIKQRLTSKRFKNRALSSLYLDQHFLAGIGNYLRSEILFASSVHPDKKPNQLSSEQLDRLSYESLHVSRKSYETGGYTLEDELLASVDKRNKDYEGQRYMVFNREELPCRLCVAPIIKATRNSRRIYWCPLCQSTE